MALKSTYRMRKKHYTPPPDLYCESGHLRTPQRANIIFAKALEQEIKTPTPLTVIEKLLGASTRSQSRIAASKQIRTLHNIEGPDPRGRKRALTRNDTAAVEYYCSDEEKTLDDRGAPWLDLATQAGVELPQTWHFKPSGYRQVNTEAVQKACRDDSGIGDYVCHEEQRLPPRIAKERVEFSEEQLEERPYSEQWNNVYFCDEFHFGVGPQTTKRVKRKRGREHRDKPMNCHRKEMPSKQVKKKVREENHLQMISVFCIVGKNYRKALTWGRWRI